MALCGCGSRRCTVSTDCGLTGNGSAASPLTANTPAWPYACDIAANAGGVYCDANGQLRGEPLNLTDYVTDGTFATFPAPGVALPTDTNTSNVVTTYTRTIDNPSDCKPAYVILEKEVDMDLLLPAGARGMYGITQDFAGGSNDELFKITNTGSTQQVSTHAQLSVMEQVTIPPGGSVDVDVVLRAGWGTNGASYTRYQINLRAFILAL